MPRVGRASGRSLHAGGGGRTDARYRALAHPADRRRDVRTRSRGRHLPQPPHTLPSPAADGRPLPEDIDGPITPGNVFDDAGRHDSLPDLRVRIADRAPSATNPLIRFAVAVLDLADSRLEASDVRELIATAVVRELFEIDDETADALAKLIEDATIRWGLDADHRAEWNTGRVDDQTWRRGLDRALSGIFYADSDVRVVPASRPGSPPAGGGAKGARIRPVAPLDGMEGSEALPVGLRKRRDLSQRPVYRRRVFRLFRSQSDGLLEKSWEPTTSSGCGYYINRAVE